MVEFREEHQRYFQDRESTGLHDINEDLIRFGDWVSVRGCSSSYARVGRALGNKPQDPNSPALYFYDDGQLFVWWLNEDTVQNHHVNQEFI